MVGRGLRCERSGRRNDAGEDASRQQGATVSTDSTGSMVLHEKTSEFPPGLEHGVGRSYSAHEKRGRSEFEPLPQPRGRVIATPGRSPGFRFVLLPIPSRPPLFRTDWQWFLSVSSRLQWRGPRRFHTGFPLRSASPLSSGLSDHHDVVELSKRERRRTRRVSNQRDRRRDTRRQANCFATETSLARVAD